MLNCTEGQLRGVQRIVKHHRDRIDVLTAISAAQAALSQVARGLLDPHAAHCVVGATEGEQAERMQELMTTVGRPLRRS